MKERDYKSNLALFKKEARNLQEPCFRDVDEWYLCGEPLNGVSIGHTVDDRCARKLIHYLGLKHGLLVLCPNDVIDIDVESSTILGSFIRSDSGKLQIKP